MKSHLPTPFNNRDLLVAQAVETVDDLIDQPVGEDELIFDRQQLAQAEVVLALQRFLDGTPHRIDAQFAPILMNSSSVWALFQSPPNYWEKSDLLMLIVS
ncbi:MAG: hypothetical protein KF893_15915 [Caldilineaceae bacterium]|nr:hypothetical protein [Caldilineaceae bacterium]